MVKTCIKKSLVIWLVVILFGCTDQEEKRSRLVDIHANASCTHERDTTVDLGKEIDHLLNKHPDKSGSYVLEDGGSSLVARAWLTEYAQESIDIQYFIFSTDNVGLIACDYLVNAADRGVKVRILIDDIMVEAEVEELLTLDQHENISIKIFNPGMNVGKSFFSKLKTLSTDFVSANKRMHNKTFIIDNKVVITGGRNIADEYFDYDHAYNFRDRDILLMGNVTETVNHSFSQFWSHELSVSIKDIIEETSYDSTLYDALHSYACDTLNFWPEIRTRIKQFPEAFKKLENTNQITWTDSVFFVSDHPTKNDSKNIDGGGVSTDTLVSLLRNAKKSIDIQTPYLITTELSRKAFKNAVDRGVKVRILTNSLASTDNLEAFNGYQRDREKLLKTGVEIYEFKPDAKSRFTTMTGALQKKIDFTPIFGLHAKTMVIDKHITVIGTFNLDPRSANLNTECLSIIYSDDLSAKVLNGMEIEFNSDNAWRTTLGFNPDHTVKRTKQFNTWTRKVVPKGIL